MCKKHKPNSLLLAFLIEILLIIMPFHADLKNSLLYGEEGMEIKIESALKAPIQAYCINEIYSALSEQWRYNSLLGGVKNYARDVSSLESCEVKIMNVLRDMKEIFNSYGSKGQIEEFNTTEASLQQQIKRAKEYFEYGDGGKAKSVLDGIGMFMGNEIVLVQPSWLIRRNGYFYIKKTNQTSHLFPGKKEYTLYNDKLEPRTLSFAEVEGAIGTSLYNFSGQGRDQLEYLIKSFSKLRYSAKGTGAMILIINTYDSAKAGFAIFIGWPTAEEAKSGFQKFSSVFTRILDIERTLDGITMKEAIYQSYTQTGGGRSVIFGSTETQGYILYKQIGKYVILFTNNDLWTPEILGFLRKDYIQNLLY